MTVSDAFVAVMDKAMDASNFLMQPNWREEELWTNEISSVLKPEIELLSKVFYRMLERKQGKEAFLVSSATKMCDRLAQVEVTDEMVIVDREGKPMASTEARRLYKLQIDSKTVTYCFCKSKKVADNHIVRDSTNHFTKLKFVEFLEFIVRVSVMAKVQIEAKSGQETVGLGKM